MNYSNGGLAEWSNALVLKTRVSFLGTAGSNPAPTANREMFLLARLLRALASQF